MSKASLQARVAAFVVRRRVRPALADMRNIAKVRRVFAQTLPAPKGVRYTPATVGGVPGEWVEVNPAKAPTADASAVPTTLPTLLYLHGGGFVGCSPRTHRPLTAAFALQGLRVFVPDYRLAPEHPFPAAPQDALAVYRALRADDPNGRIVVAGDSAGGNLTLGLLQTLRDAGEVLPAAAVMFSPALDLTGSSISGPLDSGVINATRDAMFDPAQLVHLGEAYMAGADPAHPLASPLLGDLAGLPPLLLHVGQDEVLRDDSIRLAHKARDAGVPVQIEVFPAVPHVWQLICQLPEAKRSVRAAAHFLKTAAPSKAPEQLDVLIVGAGLSGIGAAVHLQRDCPGKTHAVLEARPTLGGTWDLFRYPGIRSDSDMYTLGYAFKPWRAAKAIADGPSIRDYIHETAAEHGIHAHIRTQHRVTHADWSSATGRWHVDVDRGPNKAPLQLHPRFLMFCSGYYSYAQGHRPAFTGEAQFVGRIIHPQFWPQDFDHAGQRIVVIGSGATAVTLVPELARTAGHVTMLQRSPTYVVTLPGTDRIAQALKRWLPATLAYRLIRTKNIVVGQFFYQLSRRYPAKIKSHLVGQVQRALPQFSAADVAKHFAPHYKPWDQRVCVVPDGDLFKALRAGRASVVTDEIAHFTPQGIRLKSGEELPADVIVTATGLQLNALGDAQVSIDGVPVSPADLLVYKGMMFSGVPNLAYTFGYTNASWTLKADLTATYFYRVLRHMDRHGHTVFTPVRDATVQPQPMLDFSSGYVQRATHLLPHQGDRAPWRLHQNYALDWLALRCGRVADGVMRFEGANKKA